MTNLTPTLKSNKQIEKEIADFTIPNRYLENRVILITGASRGLGAALTQTAANLGAQTIMLARTVKDMEAIADDCLRQGSLEPSIVPMNLEGATIDDYRMVVDSVISTFGRLDGLVLNAAHLGDLTPIAEYDAVNWARVFQINLHSQFLLLQAALPHLNQAEDGSVIVSTADVGRRSRAYWGAYAVSKFASEGLVQTLADELDSTTSRINAINPGKMKTRLRAQAYPAEDANLLVAPSDVVKSFIFLLGAAGTAYNGHSLDAQT